MPNVVRFPATPQQMSNPAEGAFDQRDLLAFSRRLAQLQADTGREIRGGVLLLEIAVFRLREAVQSVAADHSDRGLDAKLDAIEELLDAARAAARTI
jgi:hypothetical protein